MGLKPLSLKSLNDCLKTLFKDGVDRREDFSLYYKVHHIPPLLSCPSSFSLADIHSRRFIYVDTRARPGKCCPAWRLSLSEPQCRARR